MDRKEWLRKLKSELHKLPKNEVEDALNYYNEYFDEAGPEHEEEILIELGSPTRVATQIKADYAVRQLDEESKVGGSHFRLGRVGSVVAAAIAGILAAPIALPIAFVLIGILLAIVCCVGAGIIALIACAVGGVIAGLAIIISGFSVLISSGAGALVFFGVGLVLVGVCTLLGYAFIRLGSWLVRALANAIRKRRAKKNAENGPSYSYGSYTAAQADEAPAKSWEETQAEEEEKEKEAAERIARAEAELAAAVAAMKQEDIGSPLDIEVSEEEIEEAAEPTEDAPAEAETEASAESVAEFLEGEEQAADEWPEAKWTTMDDIPMPDEVREAPPADIEEAAEAVEEATEEVVEETADVVIEEVSEDEE